MHVVMRDNDMDWVPQHEQTTVTVVTSTGNKAAVID